MLNPSDAGEEKDDPTIRKIVGFARRWGYGRVVAVNLCPVVATHPKDLPYWGGQNVENLEKIKYWASQSDIVVAAWGGQSAAISYKIGMSLLIKEFVSACWRDLYCIAVTKAGAPMHPSRAQYTFEPKLWRHWHAE